MQAGNWMVTLMGRYRSYLMGGERRARVFAIAGWAALAVIAGVLFDHFSSRIVMEQRASINLMDPDYPPMVAGKDWEYHEMVQADLDGDGFKEVVFVIARVQRSGNTYDFDDGQPWQIYVEELDGLRTHVYSRWVQNGNLEVYVSQDNGKSSLVVLEKQGLSLAMYRLHYGGPGVHRGELIAGVGISRRTTRH